MMSTIPIEVADRLKGRTPTRVEEIRRAIKNITKYESQPTEFVKGLKYALSILEDKR